MKAAPVYSDHVIVVLGNPSAAVRDRRLRLAAKLVRKEMPRAVIFSGYSSVPGQNSESVLMAEHWPGMLVPMLLDEASHNTADNAARSLPIIRAIGGIRRVTVVTSDYHLRAPYLFRPYESYGLRVDVRFCRSGGRLLKAAWGELKQVWQMHSVRKAAFSAPYLTMLRPKSAIEYEGHFVKTRNRSEDRG